jgi:transcriptional regulator with XRE-family HTH domain
MNRGVKISGEKLAQLRARRHFTDDEIAKAVGVHRETVTRWQQPGTHGAKASAFRKLIEFFGVPGEMIYADPQSTTTITIPTADYDGIMEMILESDGPARNFEQWISDLARHYRQDERPHLPTPEPTRQKM